MTHSQLAGRLRADDTSQLKTNEEGVFGNSAVVGTFLGEQLHAVSQSACWVEGWNYGTARDSVLVLEDGEEEQEEWAHGKVITQTWARLEPLATSDTDVDFQVANDRVEFDLVEECQVEDACADLGVACADEVVAFEAGRLERYRSSKASTLHQDRWTVGV